MNTKQNEVSKKVLGCKAALALLITLLALPFMALADDSTPDKNILNFNNVTLVSFTNDQINVTPKQSFESYIGVNNNSLTVYADRQDSEDVVSWVQKQYPFNNHPDMWNNYYMATYFHAENNAGTPSELNFAITGNLNFQYNGDTYECNNLIFGQGHYSEGNNWWIFSSAGGDGDISRKQTSINIECVVNQTATKQLLTLIFVNNNTIDVEPAGTYSL
jgi:hypothetical protein